MNRKFTKILLCGLVFTLASLPLQAELKKVGQTGYQFLKIDANARAAAMGGAVTLVGLGAENMFYNPAGLALQTMGVDVVSNQTQWFADISYITVGMSKHFGSLGTFGFSYQTADYGDIIGTQVADQGDQRQGHRDTDRVFRFSRVARHVRPHPGDAGGQDRRYARREGSVRGEPAQPLLWL